VRTLYHQTSPGAGAQILRSGFRPGRVGYCGGGIYFAETPQATDGKARGPDSHKGFIIEAVVDLGRVRHMPYTCTSSRLDIRHMDRSPVGGRLRQWGCDSLAFNPGDGMEHVIADPGRVLSTRRYR